VSRARIGRIDVLIAMALVTILAASTPATAAGVWVALRTQNPTSYNQLLGVDGIARDDVWAVGLTGADESLVEHWDGSRWSVVPDVGGGPLNDVEAIGPHDVWAVGGTDSFQPVVEHWNGSRWSSSFVPSFPQAILTSVSAVASNDVWAVGWYYDYPDGGALFLHWDGSSWSQVEGPEAAWDWVDVSALATDDVWAIANLSDSGVTATISHWDGDAWSVVPSPQFTIGSHERIRILAMAPDDVWAVGNRVTNTGAPATSWRMTIEHFDGTRWRVVKAPPASTADYGHFGIAGSAPDDIWVVGGWFPFQGSAGKTLTVHWNGSRWARVDSPNPSGGANVLEDAAAIPGGPVWAVGEYSKNFGGDQSFSISTSGSPPRQARPVGPGRYPGPMTSQADKAEAFRAPHAGKAFVSDGARG
jgi:hypothetical protein